MFNLCASVFIFSFFVLLIGIFNPRSLSLVHGKAVTPKIIFLIYGPLLLISFIGLGFYFPATPIKQTTLLPVNVATTTQTQVETYLVTRVVDGDTIEIQINGEKRIIRYIGIDTPETVHPSKPVECFGKEASAKNKELVLGKQVWLEKDVSDTDRYGRLLRYVYVDNVFINLELVQGGYANAYSYPPDVKNNELFRKAESEARNAKAGLWSSACTTSSI